MLFLFVALWLTGALLLFTESKRASTYWASATAFCGGAGGLSVVIEERILPFVIEAYNHAFLEIALSTGGGIFSFVSHYFTPYSFIMFAICYSGLFSKRYSYYAVAILFCLV